MKNFITSNFNLLHKNNSWSKLKNKKDLNIDENYNNYHFSINNEKILKEYDIFHIIIYLNERNLNETTNKIKNLEKQFKKFKNKLFFIYFFLDISKNIKIHNTLYKSVAKIIINQKKILENNLFFDIFNNFSNEFFNQRNKTFLKFPFDLKAIKFFNKIIAQKIDIVKSKPYKLIILDGDNTLWGGILDESGISGIVYGEDGYGDVFVEFQKKLKSLKNLGFLLTISSKNNENKVWELMKKKSMVLQKNDFISPKINWNEKFLNINKILIELNLRPHDAIFVDDNILEIEKVKKKVKKINVLSFKDPLEMLEKFNKDYRFQKIQITNSDLKKYKQYEIKSKFEKAKDKQGLNMKFYKGLNQKIKVKTCNKSNFQRTLQLFNKTNQFNFCLNRYSSSKLKKILENKNYNVKLFELTDKFGFHGIIGAYISLKKKSKINVIDFVVSCRVISRYVEDFMIYHLINNYRRSKCYIKYVKHSSNKNLIPSFLNKTYFKIFKKLNNDRIYEIIENNEIKNVKKIF